MVTTVLLVDDVAELRSTLHQALRLRGGFDVLAEAANGADAVAAARAHQPDIVVLDLGLPDLAGHEVLTRLRAAAPAARVVVYSGSHISDRPAIAASVEAFVEKSQDVGYLVDLLSGMGPRIDRAAILELGPELTGIAVARRFVVGRCAELGCPSLAEDAQLVVTELVTNALLHAHSGCELVLGLAGEQLRMEVVDHGTGTPDLQVAGPSDEGGRGLLLVSVLCAAWGAESVEGGKRVWAELSLPEAPGGGAGQRRGQPAAGPGGQRPPGPP